MRNKVKLKYTYTVTVDVDCSSYNGCHVNEALDGKQGTDEHILAIESDINQAFATLEYVLGNGEGDVKVEIVK